MRPAPHAEIAQLVERLAPALRRDLEDAIDLWLSRDDQARTTTSAAPSERRARLSSFLLALTLAPVEVAHADPRD